MDEHNRPLFKINGISDTILESLIAFCYSGDMAIDENTVDGILGAASLMQFDRVREICRTYLEKMLNFTNCLGIWAMARQYELVDIMDKAFEMALWHFKKVVRGTEFPHIDLEFMKIYLSHDDVNDHSEEQIVEAIISWIEFDQENRKDTFPQLLETVRLHHLKETVGVPTYSNLFVIIIKINHK